MTQNCREDKGLYNYLRYLQAKFHLVQVKVAKLATYPYMMGRNENSLRKR